MILGFDISTFNGDMSLAQSKLHGIRFNICRATFPSKAVKYMNTDVRFTQNADASPNFFPTTAYHVFRPQWDGAWQADGFYQAISEKNFFNHVAIDVELNEYNQSKGVFQTELLKFIDRLAYYGYDSPLIYTRASFWNPNVGNPSWASKYPLWVARYGTSQPWYGENDPYRPLPWNNWTLWQWSADGNGLGDYYGAQSNSIDLNYFNGDETAFAAFFGQTPPQPEEEFVRYKTLATKLNIRESPNKTSNDIGDLYAGDVVGAFGATKDSAGNDWARLGLDQWAAINEKVNGVVYTYMQLTTDPINRIDL